MRPSVTRVRTAYEHPSDSGCPEIRILGSVLGSPYGGEIAISATKFALIQSEPFKVERALGYEFLLDARSTPSQSAEI